MKLLNTLSIVLFVALSSCSNESETNTTQGKAIPGDHNTTFNIPDGNYSLTKESSLSWSASKINGSTHIGEIFAVKGNISVSQGATQGSIRIDMNSFTCTDLEGEDKAGFDSHLKSEDFLDVDKFPFAEVIIKGIKTNNLIKGNTSASIASTSIELLLHGVKIKYIEPITINEVKTNKGIVGYEIKGKLKVDRTKHNINYGSSSFFKELGDRAIRNEVDINFTFTFI